MTDPRVQASRRIRNHFVAAAAATGAIPVPGASVAVQAEMTAMVVAIAAEFDVLVDLAMVEVLLVKAGFGAAFKTLFMEGARAMGWFGGPAGCGGVMALGASTAALEAFVTGEMAIAVACAASRGTSVSVDDARSTIRRARKDFRRWWEDEGPMAEA